MTNLLATIVGSRHLPPEPVATDALVHLCASSATAGSTMANLLLELCPETSTTGLVFTGQEINPETEGRPDLVASDSLGTRLVVEAKFDAALTLAQTGGAYVNKLSAGVPGVLMFLVPQDRMKNLWRTVSVAPGGAPLPISLTDEEVDAGVKSMPLQVTGHVLAVMSWESLLSRLGAAATEGADTAAEAELAQIRGLVDWRTSVGWMPLTPGDLPQRVGRQLQGVSEVLKSVAMQVSAKTVRNGSGDLGFGRYIATPAGKSLWVGIWLSWWDKRGPGPAWAQVKLKTAQETVLLSEALTVVGVDHHPRTKETDILVSLDLPLGAERGATEESVRRQVQALMTAVDALAVEVIEDITEGGEEEQALG